MGYSCVQKGNRCYCPTLRRYFVSIDVAFFETSQGEEDDLLVYIVSSRAPTLVPIPIKPPITQMYSRRQTLQSLVHRLLHHQIQSRVMIFRLLFVKVQVSVLTQSLRLFPITILLSSSCSFIASLDSISFPHIVHEALSHPSWRSTMVDEMQALDDNGTWDLVPLHTGKKAIGRRWVFAIKFNPDGSIAKLKARLVAKGYAQTYGVDYSYTFSPIAKLTSIRVFISLVVSHNWDLYQLDIKNVFLYGDLQ